MFGSNKTMRVAALLLLLSLPAQAARDDGPRKTYWDQLMQRQSTRAMYKGSRLMDSGRYGDAVEEFAKAVIAHPEDARAHQMLGVAYYWSGQVERAEVEFIESLRLDPKSAQGHVLLGIALAWRGQAKQSYEHFKIAGDIAPDRADIQMNLGSMEEAIGQVPQALMHYRKAVELQGDHPLYHFQLGTLYRTLGRDNDAVASLKKAVKLFPDYEDALLELGALYERMGQSDDAIAMFGRSVKLKRRDAVARFRLARAYLKAGRRSKSEAVLGEVFHLTPSDEGGGLALSLSYGGQPNEGGGSGAGKGKTPEKKKDEPQGPLDLLRRNLERIPLDKEARLEVDMAFLPKIDPTMERARKAKEAPSRLKRALEDAGKMPQGSVVAAKREFKLASSNAAERSKQIKRVVDDLKNVLDSAPPNSETRFGMNLSFTDPNPTLSDPSKRKKRGRTSFQPRDVGNDMGLWVKGTGWMALVDEVLTRRGEKMRHSQHAAWWVIEGIGLATLGEAGRAAEAFARALELEPNNELAHLGAGVVRVISGDETGAIAAYRRALEINPKNRAARDGLRWLERGSAVAEAAQ
jgi:tetratricopeptide (TPR) repeat protein